MVGEGVLHECLLSPEVEQVLVINRRPCGVVHPKLTEVLHQNFLDISPILPQLQGYNACFFCLGVSSVGMNEKEYSRFTYDLTLHFGSSLATLNPGMTFIYISGSGTDSTQKGRQMWARVKGKTENDLMKLPFKKVYAFRPGYMIPTKGLKNTLPLYKPLGLLNPVLKLFTGFVSTLAQVGQAMIHAVTLGYEKNILEVRDIIQLAERK